MKRPLILAYLGVMLIICAGCDNPEEPEAEEWKIVEQSGPILVNVTGSLEAPKISWDDGNENTCYSISISSSSEEAMWRITYGGLSSPVTYGQVPEGATVETEAKLLEKGTQYTFSVFWATITVGTTNKGFGFVDVVYE